MKKGYKIFLGIIVGVLLVVSLGFNCYNLFYKENDVKCKDDNLEKHECNCSKYEEKNNSKNSISMICAAVTYDKLEILDMENKNEKIGAIGGSKIGYNVTTVVTKNHNYSSTPNNNELYANDMEGTLYVLYNNKLYYTKQNEIISKYCTSNGDFSWQRTCDYSKFNDNNIREFNVVNINVNLKSIGSYGDAGSGMPMPYAITTDGKVINMPDILSNNYSSCGVMYDSSEYPIDRIFNMNFYDGVEYTILLKNGTLITRNVDREHPIEYEH